MLNKLKEKKAELLTKLEAVKLTVNSIASKIDLIDELIEEEEAVAVKQEYTAVIDGEELPLKEEVI